MLNEGTCGNSKAQILGVIGNYQPVSYINSQNISFANALFVNNKYEKYINKNYVNNLTTKYNAEVKSDSFSNPNSINSWISEKTFGVINNLVDNISQEDLILINALAIDMNWEEKFMLQPIVGIQVNYKHENFNWTGDKNIMPKAFKDNEEEVSGMEIIASFNNYDIVNVLGEENIRKIVKSEFQKYLQQNPKTDMSFYLPKNDIIGLSNEEIIEKYLDKYIEEIDSNYKSEDKTTDFSYYIDENVKAFAKDLKKYDGVALQYVSIMPTNDNLYDYINKIDVNSITNIINNLKSLKSENFKNGVVTKITGFIPKFKFEYNLNLVEDLKALGITDIFESDKANLTNLSTNKSLYVNNVIHKSTIELTQDGIKASSTTASSGGSGGVLFDYLFDVPVEEIDLTFDKPFMFLIRNKESGEVWFAGTVYNPLPYSQDTSIATSNAK